MVSHMNHAHTGDELASTNDALTFVDVWLDEEVTIHCLGDRSQGVAGLQSVVPIVDMCGVVESQTALQIVLVEVHLSSDVVTLDNLLLLVEPTEFWVRVPPNRELNAGVEALLRLGQSQDYWRNCSERLKETLSFKIHRSIYNNTVQNMREYL